MSAQVLGCGHASCHFETDFLEAAPQVHLHFLTDAAEQVKLGFSRVELCCHGCGASLLLIYPEKATTRAVKVRDTFGKSHQACRNRNFENACPDYRSSSTVVDLRKSEYSVRWKTQRAKRRKEIGDKVMLPIPIAHRSARKVVS